MSIAPQYGPLTIRIENANGKTLRKYEGEPDIFAIHDDAELRVHVDPVGTLTSLVTALTISDAFLHDDEMIEAEEDAPQIY